MLDMMYRYGSQPPKLSKNHLPSPESTSQSDSESDIAVELEQKRRQIEDEVSHFRSQKDKEFNDFEHDLRANRRRKRSMTPSHDSPSRSNKASSKFHKSSSTSALDLLVGHGAPIPHQMNGIRHGRKDRAYAKKDMACPKAGPLPSKATLSLEPLHIQGETIIPSSTKLHDALTPSGPTEILSRTSSSSSLASAASRQRPVMPPTPMHEKREAFAAGLFTPSYLPLLESNSNPPFTSPSPLVTPPADELTEEESLSRTTSLLCDGVLPLQSSSYPPHMSVLISNGPANKRSYTAPAATAVRKPSALRSASTSNIARKRKHVTFRLADSAIVEPSSSYEEGSSPQLEDDGEEETKSQGQQSPRRQSRSSALSRKLSDEEEEEAGVKPGMMMGEVMQKLHEYVIADSADDDEDENENVESDAEEEDVAYTATKYHEDDEDEDSVERDRGERMSRSEEEEEEEAEGYFSPRAMHMSVVPHIKNASPLAPCRDNDWNQLSSSDKDRLLFGRRNSDESDRENTEDIRSARAQLQNHAARSSAEHGPGTGFSGGLQGAIDGGSGVGFFELDEELASPDAGQVKPFDFDLDAVDDGEVEPSETTDPDGARAAKDFERRIPSNVAPKDAEKRWSNPVFAGFGAGIGSVPINIVRPSVSVSSSWVGTFGH